MMDYTGVIHSISLDLSTNKPVIALRVNQNDTEGIRSLSEYENLDIRIRRHRDKRSLDANAYYWTLLTKLAKVLGISNPEAHNIQLQNHGEFEKLDGKLVSIPLPDTDEVLESVRKKTEYHLCPTSKVTSMKGVMHRIYFLMRGSSTYNTSEMSRLIKGLIEDCREAGIPDCEIMTPFEKQKLREQYGIE